MDRVLVKMGLSIDDKFRTITALMLIPIVIWTCGFACNTQTVLQRVDSILNEVGPALQIVVTLLPLLTGKNIPSNVTQAVQTWTPRVQADITQLESLLSQYQNDLSTNTTAQAQINALIATTEQDITSILPIFQVVDTATQQKITQIITAIAAGVASVENIIAAAEGKVSIKVAAANGIRDGKSFKAVVNSALHVPTGDQTVDAATAQVKF